MNAKISIFVTCVEVIKYFLLCNLHDCTFNIYIRFFKILRSRSKLPQSNDVYVKLNRKLFSIER